MTTLKDRKRKEAEENLKKYESKLERLLKNKSPDQEQIIECQHMIHKNKQILHNLGIKK